VPTRCQRARSLFSPALAPFARHVRALTRRASLSLTQPLFASFSFHQGIDPTVDYKKVLKAFKKEFCCNGTVVEDPEQARAARRAGTAVMHRMRVLRCARMC
jgi:hypothetical protein